MKTFDISKNIILAFIILISIALKLSAHESTTSLISNDNVSSEKDKKSENTSKRNVQNKTILCYERNKRDIIGNIIYSSIGGFFGAGFALLGSLIYNWFTERERKKTIKKELEGNKGYLTEKYKHVCEELLENDLSKLEKYLSEKGINNAINFDFNNEDEFNKKFKPRLNLQILCKEINKSLKKEQQILAVDTELNNLLCNPRFYDDIFKKIKPDISLSKEKEIIQDLVNYTKGYQNKTPSQLTDIERYFIKRLNRLLIEEAYPEECPNIKVTRLTKDLESDYFIHLSDTSWNQYKYVISNREYIISKAYMLIGEIHALSNASIRTDKGTTLPRLAQAIINAKDAIDKAIEKL